MKKDGMIKRKDWILFAIICILSLILLLIFFNKGKAGNVVVVEQNGEIIMELSLKEEGCYVILDGDDRNELVIADGFAYVKDANCNDLVCIQRGKISQVNETIACLPHRLIIYIKGNGQNDIDAVVN